MDVSLKTLLMQQQGTDSFSGRKNIIIIIKSSTTVLRDREKTVVAWILFLHILLPAPPTLRLESRPSVLILRVSARTLGRRMRGSSVGAAVVALAV